MGCLHGFMGGGVGGRALRSGGPGGRGPGGSSGPGEFVVNWPLRYFFVSLALEVRNLECHLPPPSTLSAVA